MGYFSNSSEGVDYEARYCQRCVHGSEDGPGCAVWLAHILHNYGECNKHDSILRLLIPRDKDGRNQQCAMWVAQPDPQVKKARTRT